MADLLEPERRWWCGRVGVVGGGGDDNSILEGKQDNNSHTWGRMHNGVRLGF